MKVRPGTWEKVFAIPNCQYRTEAAKTVRYYGKKEEEGEVSFDGHSIMTMKQIQFDESEEYVTEDGVRSTVLPTAWVDPKPKRKQIAAVDVSDILIPCKHCGKDIAIDEYQNCICNTALHKGCGVGPKEKSRCHGCGITFYIVG